jgi:hypothetical protein
MIGVYCGCGQSQRKIIVGISPISQMSPIAYIASAHEAITSTPG